jgi:anti-anti-sigma factor
MDYVDSAALNVFIYSKNVIEKSGGIFCILEPNEYITNMLAVVGLTNVFTICENRDMLKSISRL